MEPISVLLTTALGYILRGAAQSKAADNAKEEVLKGFWKWIKGKFVKEAPELEANPDDPQAIAKTKSRLEELLKDESFRIELEQRISTVKREENRSYEVNANHYGSGDIVNGDKNANTTNYYGAPPPQK